MIIAIFQTIRLQCLFIEEHLESIDSIPRQELLTRVAIAIFQR